MKKTQKETVDDQSLVASPCARPSARVCPPAGRSQHVRGQGNTHSPAGNACWPLPSLGLSSLAAKYCLLILLIFGICSCPDGVSDLAMVGVFCKRGPGTLL